MFSPAERRRAVELYFTTPMTTAQVVRHLGYPTRQCLERWLAADPRYAGHMSKPIIPLETRTKVIELVLDGMQQKQAAERLGVSVGAVHNWVKAYREGGMAALQPKNRNAGQADKPSDATGLGRRRRRGPAPQGRGAGTGERGDAGGLCPKSCAKAVRPVAGSVSVGCLHGVTESGHVQEVLRKSGSARCRVGFSRLSAWCHRVGTCPGSVGLTIHCR